jgi:hypothetical protein
MDVDNPREGYCKQSVYVASGNWGHSHQCSRKVKLDGYCKQHHPDTVKARDDAQRAKWAAESAARENSYIDAEKENRERILDPLIEALTEMRDEYAVSQPCRPAASIVDLALDLVREGLTVPDTS